MNQSSAFVLLREALTDQALVQALQSNPGPVLGARGILDQETTQSVLAILSLMASGAAIQQDAIKQQQAQIADAQQGTFDVAKQMKFGLRNTLDQVDRAYRSTMLMYQVTFYLGVILVLVAVGVALLGSEPLLPAVFGTLGTVDLLAFFFLKPQERLQSSRSSLAQVQAALYNWFMDTANLNGLMSVMGQAQDFAGVERVSEALLLHTEKTLEMLQKYCKLTDR